MAVGVRVDRPRPSASPETSLAGFCPCSTAQRVDKPDVMLEESANKGSVYGKSSMSVVPVLEDAIADCRTERLANNDMGVDALDGAWAFYVGSLEGSDGSGSGVQPSSSAEKRCQNFRTCSGADGISEEATANQILRQHFEVLRGQLSSGLSDEAWTTVMGIVQQRAVPVMQGMLRYAYKADAANGIGGPKEIAEGWAFAGGVLPQIHSCSPSAAALVQRRHTQPPPPLTSPAVVYGIRTNEILQFFPISCTAHTCLFS